MVLMMGTNCAPLLADLFFYSYEAYFMKEKRKEASPILTFHVPLYR